MAAPVLHAFSEGVRAAVSSLAARALGWCYLASLATAAVFFIPFFLFVRSTVAGSAMSHELRGGQVPDWIVDLGGSPTIGPTIGLFFVVALILVPVYLLLVVALTGGVIEYLAAALGVRKNPRPFLAACGDLFGPALRVFVVEAPVVGLIVFVLALVRGVLALLVTHPIVAWAWLVVLLVLLAFVTAYFDFARIRLYFLGDRKALRSLGDAFRFTFEKFFSVVGLATLNALVACLTLVLFVWLHSLVGLDSPIGVLAGIFVGQLSILARLWCRVAACGSEIALWSRYGMERAKNLD